MIYEMKLVSSPFEKIVSGRKTIELRLFDDKRRKIDIGDKIIFTSTTEPIQRIAVIVIALHRYATFFDLFKDVSLEKCGNEITDTPELAATKMRKYYADTQVQLYGVVGIEFALVDLEIALKQLEDQKEAEFERLFPDGMK